MSDMESESLGGLESALGAAFGDPAPEVPQAKAPKAPKAAPETIEPEAPPQEDPADLLAGQEEEAAPVEKEPEADPEFEIEIEPGKPEVLPLARLKELAARGAKAGRGFEENARVREALQAHVQQHQIQQQFQQAVSSDVAQLHALDQQIQAYDKVDWVAAYDNDLTNALKLKEQRDQLRQQRAALVEGLNAKQQQFQAQLTESAQRALAAENEALMAKVPAWRNVEKAKAELGEITNALMTHYGFTQAEANQVRDHRMVLVAKDAAAFRKLLANKDARVKQAREAPATAKPGAAAQPDGRAEFNKFKGKVKELGTKGNHRAQEDLMMRALGRAFK